MWNKPTKEILNTIPELNSTEEIPLKDKLIYLHFFMFGCDWYIAEFDPKTNMFFGFVILNEDYQNAEWGIISFDELSMLKVSGIEVDCDLYWDIRKSSDINQIKLCVQSGCYEEKQSHNSTY